MQQKMILQSISPEQTVDEPTEQTKRVLLRGILMAFAAAGLVTEQQAREAVERIEREMRP